MKPEIVQRNDTVTLVYEAPGVTLLARRTGPSFERHAHTSYDMAQHNGDHTHPSAADGHAWLDTDNAKAMVEHIAVVLSAKDPAHRATFSSNAETLQGRLDRLGTELASTLRPVASKPYIVFHDALQYFERRFGLNDVGSISLSPEIPPGAKRLTQLREPIDRAGAFGVRLLGESLHHHINQRQQRLLKGCDFAQARQGFQPGQQLAQLVEPLKMLRRRGKRQPCGDM